ncbi:hypothetical protein [Nodularia sphaerocarpa]|uniref:hypothetical protein n=1 Tax=Nodularia sphaerocarpa TaxID=137816 RepID=UPI001EFA873B|nr:hypothetical protein [Nodularia sphaerocarpa]MDB9375753.1 hypothetical protein [Nodularia sphaerocarpa CS-585]MDB9377233.1 hypothetical protein [Nodularia sphaerocarpa CS-585A2]ULP73104.1 hypothetical protein BDGGKGIB_02757 [Nodularia sphaerocarpa UHCC 0038]
MPSYTRGQNRRDFYYVEINPYAYFVFKPKNLAAITGVTADDILALGHTPPESVFLGRFRIFGANSPKPPRVTKKIRVESVAQQKSVSTFCGYNAIASAAARGWKLTAGRQSVRLNALSEFRRSLTAIATLTDGYLYCFPMNKEDFTLFGTQLGLRLGATFTSDLDKAKMVTGSSSPYPAKVSKLLGQATFTTFCSTDRLASAIAEGFNVVSEERYVPVDSVPF